MNEIKHNNETAAGSFFVEDAGERKAELIYSWRGENTLVIEHTEVNESLQGQGVAKKLVEAAVSYARNKHLKIIPQCSYARHVMEKDKSYEDVLYKE